VRERLEILPVDSALIPYATTDQYRRWLEVIRRDPDQSTAELGETPLHLSGDYGANLFEEVGRYAAAAGRAVRHADYDVIHAHDWMTFLAGYEAKRLTGAPLVAHLHATEFDRSGEHVNQGVYEIERMGLQGADRIIAVSGRTKEMAVAHYGIDPKKIAVVHNGAVHEASDRPRSRHPLGGPLVVFLGRVTMQKGPEYFVEACRLVAERLPEARFAMAGNGDLLPQMIDRVAELDLIDRFHFLGFVDAKRRDALLRQADLLVMPSVSEPFGIVPLEGMAKGVPVVITKQSGVSEVLRHVFKVDFWDVRRMADVIVTILLNPELKRQLVEGGSEDLAEITWERAARQVMDVYGRMQGVH
jgi:glycosyltransferase involved in cell wall biosynthesis